MRSVPQAVANIKYIHTAYQPNFTVKGPTANRPAEATIEPVPLIRPVTVPSDLLLPLTDGWDARSAATADVMILFGLEIVQRHSR